MARRGDGQRGTDGADAGFAAADALVALTLAAMLLAIVLNATVIALRAGRSAVERRLAGVEAQYRLASDWPRLNGPGEVSGQSASGLFGWSLSARAVPGAAEGTPEICAITATVSAKASRRSYRLDTVRFCSPATGRG